MSRGEESMSKKDFFPIKTVLWANKKQKKSFSRHIESNRESNRIKLVTFTIFETLFG